MDCPGRLSETEITWEIIKVVKIEDLDSIVMMVADFEIQDCLVIPQEQHWSHSKCRAGRLATAMGHFKTNRTLLYKIVHEFTREPTREFTREFTSEFTSEFIEVCVVIFVATLHFFFH